MELSPDQIFLVGIVASLLAAAIRLITAWVGGIELGKGWMSVIAGVVSLILAVLFALPESLPICTEFMPCVTEWLALISAYVGFATLIYNIILDKLLDAVKLNTERFLK